MPGVLLSAIRAETVLAVVCINHRSEIDPLPLHFCKVSLGASGLRPTGLILSVLAGVSFLSACNHSHEPSGFAIVLADRNTKGPSAYPLAVDPQRVGTYPPDTGSGAGYFHDEVLEYRVWFHPENGAEHLNGKKDYFVAFAQYEAAEALSKEKPGGEPPLVLVRQLEWIPA
jgi:hypothetical protein